LEERRGEDPSGRSLFKLGPCRKEFSAGDLDQNEKIKLEGRGEVAPPGRFLFKLGPCRQDFSADDLDQSEEIKLREIVSRRFLRGRCRSKREDQIGVSCHEFIIRALLPGLYEEETVARTLRSRIFCEDSIIKRLLPRLYYQDLPRL
jgi:hypothetical protein